MKIQLLGEFPVPTAMYKTVMYWISLLVLTMPIALPSVANADSVTLDDHGTAVCWLYNDCDRYDWAVMHVTVVTGNVWNHDDWTAQYFDLRLRDAAGNVLRTGMHVAYGAPAGTVVTEFDYTQVYPFCALPPGNVSAWISDTMFPWRIG
jgi:hypothetical protein